MVNGKEGSLKIMSSVSVSQGTVCECTHPGSSGITTTSSSSIAFMLLSLGNSLLNFFLNYLICYARKALDSTHFSISMGTQQHTCPFWPSPKSAAQIAPLIAASPKSCSWAWSLTGETLSQANKPAFLDCSCIFHIQITVDCKWDLN